VETSLKHEKFRSIGYTCCRIKYMLFILLAPIVDFLGFQLPEVKEQKIVKIRNLSTFSV
jgi:hypothetical protein